MKPNKTPRKHAAFASSSRQMKRRPKVKSFLAVLVAFCTVCALTMPAATLEGQAQVSCGLAEHTHDESCYESVLVCGQEESEGHVHDESCYEEVLTCEIPEHTHSEACWAQPETQAEAGNEENSEAVTGDGAGSDMEAAAGTETGTDTEADTGTGTGTDSSENGDAAEAGSETDSSGNAGTGAGDNGSAEAGAESGDGQTENGDAGSEADGTGENGSGTETAGEQGESTSAEDALTEADKTEQAENPQAAEEAAEMPDGAAVPDGYTEQYTVRDEENGFAVTVYAPEGVVPEGAVLSAELLSEETEEYAAAEQELAAETEAVMAENGVSALSEDGADAASEDGEAAAPSYGFAALDIHFEYENGEEVEPNGDVYVVIDAAGLLPEDADPESVTVQHHAEQEDGSVTVETVADTAEETAGVVAVVENEAQAENDVQAAFEVSGFSTFTIRWSGWSTNYFQVTVHYVDENGVSIKGTQSQNISISGSDGENRITFADYAGTIEDYTYTGAHYGGYTGREITHMVATEETSVSGWGQTTTRTLIFYNDNNIIEQLEYDGGGFWPSPETAEIYLVYNWEGSSQTEATYTLTWETTIGGRPWEEEETVQTGVGIELYVYNSETEEYELLDAEDYEDYNETLANGGSWTAFEDAPDISGYTLTNAYYNTVEENVQTWNTLGLDTEVSAQYNRSWSFSIGNYSWPFSGERYSRTIRLYYDPTDTTGGGSTGEVTEPAPGYSKTATLNDDGTYDLTLSVTGSVGSQTNQALVDVLMIVDVSNSMTNNGSSRMSNAKTAMETLVSTLESKNGVDARYSIVSFSGPADPGDSGKEKDASIVLDWSSVLGTDLQNSNVYKAINGLKTVGGTDYEAGLDKGASQLSGTREGAITVVIFLSDGQPTWSYSYGSGNSALDRTDEGYNSTYNGWVDTLKKAENISCTYFYSVGIGNSSSDYLKDVANEVTATNATEERYIEANEDGSNLTGIFQNIVASSTAIHVSGVNITDTLSENVKAVVDTNNNPVELRVTVTDANGNDVTDEVAQISIDQQGNYQQGSQYIYPTYSDGVLELRFPADYTLVNGYTYSLTMLIEPSATAEISYAQTGNYPDIPETGTGTHAEQQEKGFYSNRDESAILTYLVEGEQESTPVEYNMPVVQVQKGYLSLSKKLEEGTTVEDGTDFEFTISIPAAYAATYNAVYINTESGQESVTEQITFNVTAGAEYATAVISLEAGQTIIIALPDGIQVTITENSEEFIPDWQGAEVNEDGSVTVNIDKETKSVLQCTNSFAVKYEDIVIHKMNGDKTLSLDGAEFQLYYVENGKKYYYSNAQGTVSWIPEDEIDGVDIIQSSESGGKITLQDLVVGNTYYLVETKAPDGYKLLEHEIVISWNGDGSLTAYYNTVPSMLLDVDQGTKTITVTNSTGTELPETGGPGTTILTIGGLLLMAGAVGGGYGLRRRRGKEGR